MVDWTNCIVVVVILICSCDYYVMYVVVRFPLLESYGKI